MNEYPLYVNCFCYNKDENLLEYSLGSIRKIYGDRAEIYIWDDDNYPISDEIRKKLEAELDVKYNRTTFDRHRNLNGRTCVLGILDCLRKSAKMRDGLVMKLDADTMITSTNFIDEFWAMPNSKYAATCRPGCHFSGICYFMHADILDETYKLVKQWEFIPEERGPEDYIIGLACSVAALPTLSHQISVWNSAGNGDNGTSVGWNYKCPLCKESMTFYKNKFNLITFGNWFMHSNLTMADRIPPMKMLYSLL